MANTAVSKSVAISAPKFGRAEFNIVGETVLVIHRFSAKTKARQGPARLGWQDVPLAQPADTLHLPLALG